MCTLIHQVDAVLEIGQQCGGEIETFLRTLLQPEIANVEVSHPVSWEAIESRLRLMLEDGGELEPRAPQQGHGIESLEQHLLSRLLVALLTENATVQEKVGCRERSLILQILVLNRLKLLLVRRCDGEGRRLDLVGRIKTFLFDLLLANKVGRVVAEEYRRLPAFVSQSVRSLPILAKIEQRPGKLQPIRLVARPLEVHGAEVRTAPRQVGRGHVLLTILVCLLILGQKFANPLARLIQTVRSAVVQVEAELTLDRRSVLRKLDESLW